MTQEEAAAKAQHVMEMIHQKSALDCPIDGEEYVIAALLDAVEQERERCAGIADYWSAGKWTVQPNGRVRFSAQDLQATCNTTGRGIAEDIRNPSSQGVQK
jgi:hypothetical protein